MIKTKKQMFIVVGDSAFGDNLTSVTIQGKSSPADFDSYGNGIWSWADGYDDSNIVWTGSN